MNDVGTVHGIFTVLGLFAFVLSIHLGHRKKADWEKDSNNRWLHVIVRFKYLAFFLAVAIAGAFFVNGFYAVGVWIACVGAFLDAFVFDFMPRPRNRGW